MNQGKRMRVRVRMNKRRRMESGEKTGTFRREGRCHIVLGQTWHADQDLLMNPLLSCLCEEERKR